MIYSESHHWLHILRNIYLDVVRVQYWHDIDCGKLPRLSSSGPYMLYTVDKAEANIDKDIGIIDLLKIIQHTSPEHDFEVNFIRKLRYYLPKILILKILH